MVAGGDELTVQVAVRNDGLLPVFEPAVTVAGGTGWTVTPLSQGTGFPRRRPAGDVRVHREAPRRGRARIRESDRVDVVPDDRVRRAAADDRVTDRGRAGAAEWDCAALAPRVDHRDQRLDVADRGRERRWRIPIKLVGTTYPTGIGVASPSLVRYYLGKACTRLTGTVGIDDAVSNVGPDGGTSTFQVVGDGKVLFDSGVVDRVHTRSRSTST